MHKLKIKGNIKMKVIVTDDTIDRIMFKGIDTGISYWCPVVAPSGDKWYGARWSHEIISRGGYLDFLTNDNKICTLGKRQLLRGLAKAISSGQIICLKDNTVDKNMITPEDADVIIQFALFNEIIYYN